MTESAQRQDLQRRVLFVRIGWMRFYDGPTPHDEKPIGGGSYTEGHIGHEAYNFREASGSLYGYFQPSHETICLERIDPSGAGADHLSGVLVAMIACRVKGGQVIVGWYRDATVFRKKKPHSPGKPEGYGHFCSSKRKDCVLLPEYNRTFEIPQGKGGLGQANICYDRDTKGEQKSAAWIKEAINFIESYRASNILDNPGADAER